MTDLFKDIYKNEKNENTALILMLGVLSEKLSEIAIEIEKSNKLSKEILSCLKGAKEAPTKEILIFKPLAREDYID